MINYIKLINFDIYLFLNFIRFKILNIELLIGDWGLGIGDWGLGPIPNPQSPIPNPHSLIPIKIEKFI